LTEQIELGRVSRPHGLRGEIEVRLHWPESTALLEAETVVLSAPAATGAEGAQRICRVRYARATPKGVLLCLHEVADRDAAEALKGWSVSLERTVLPPLEPGEYYLCDTVGAEVLGPDGTRIGKVGALRLYPSVDALLIEREDGGQAEQPLVDGFVSEVDVVQKRIVLASLEGLIEVSAAGAASDASDGSAAEAISPAKRRSKRAGRGKRSA
jgi:16S rRNA processing protein RimM